MVLKRVEVWSAARVLGAMYAGLGLAIGAVVATVSLLGAGLTHGAGAQDFPPAYLSVLLGVGAVIFMPILYGLLGLLSGAFGAWLYNKFSGMVGGLEIELQ